MNPLDPKEIVLIRSIFYTKPSSFVKKYSLIIILLLVTIMMIAPILLIGIDNIQQHDWKTFFQENLKSIQERPMDTYLPILLVLSLGPVLFYFSQAKKRERLILNESGMHYQSPLSGRLKFLKADWQIRWAEVKEIKIKPVSKNLHPAHMILEIKTSAQCHLLKPLQWIDPDDVSAEQYQLSKLLRIRDPEQLNILWKEHPFIRLLNKNSMILLQEEISEFIHFDFDLAKNVYTLSAVVLIFLLVLYFLADSMANLEVYAGRPFYEIYIFIAIIVFRLSWGLLKFVKVPVGITIGLAIILGIATGFASYPGALRLNQLTDRRGLQNYDYQMQADYSFVPDRKNLPILTFPRERNMWSRYPKGYRYAFKLRKGGLGFYQIDLAPVYEKFQQDWSGKKTG